MYKCQHCQTEYDVRPAGDNCSHCGAPMPRATKTDVESFSSRPEPVQVLAPTPRPIEPAPINRAKKNSQSFWDALGGCLSLLAVPLGGILVLFIDYLGVIYGGPVYNYLWDGVWGWSVWQPWSWPVPWDFFEPLVGGLLYLIVGIPMMLPALIWGLLALGSFLMIVFPISLFSKDATN